ncbi:MAG: hypothetical protein ACJ71F_05950, partial [Nitrososphaeraceae archaeon]
QNAHDKNTLCFYQNNSYSSGKLLTLHNITNEVSFAGEVNASNLPNLPPSKPSVIIINNFVNKLVY